MRGTRLKNAGVGVLGFLAKTYSFNDRIPGGRIFPY